MCGAGFCRSCTADPDSWKTEHAPITNLVVSGSCQQDTAGVVEWSSPVLLSNTLSGKATIRGNCPLINAEENAVIKNMSFECIGGTAAINVLGPGVQIDASVSGAGLVRAVQVEGLQIVGMSVTGSVSQGDFPLVVLGHTEGDYQITCLNSDEVVSQPLSGTGTYEGCSVVDVAQLLNVFGRHYEVEYNNKNAFDTTNANLLAPLILITIAGAIILVLAHQDLFVLYTARKSKKKQLNRKKKIFVGSQGLCIPKR